LAFALAALSVALTAAGADKPAAAIWVAPKEERGRTNPVVASVETLRKGRALYQRHCAMCHGDKGQADGPAARLHAERSHRSVRDLTDPQVQASITDGEIFWKLSTGLREEDRVVMPGFVREIADEADRWKVVLFVRSLGPTRP
jgi:mono/diheme cytochrome c family protein